MNDSRSSGYKILFGPVPSRRLGLSLGIDLFASKICSFNCVYCECGKTEKLTVQRSEYVPFSDLEAELRRYFPCDELDWVTFAGKGEPTLYSRLGDGIRLIRELTTTPVAVITNASLIMQPDVRADLALADLVMPSLDSATQKTLGRINRHHPSVRVDEIIEGLIEFRGGFSGKLALEILFCHGFNDSPAEIDALIAAVRKIKPDTVQLNTVDRMPAVSSTQALSHEELLAIKKRFATGNVEVIGAWHSDKHTETTRSVEEQILSLLDRRSVEEKALIESLSVKADLAQRILDRLCRKQMIERVLFENRWNYRLTKNKT